MMMIIRIETVISGRLTVNDIVQSFTVVGSYSTVQ